MLVTSYLVSTILDPCILAVHDGADCRSGGGNVSVPRVGEISLERAGEEAYTLSRHPTFAHTPPLKKLPDVPVRLCVGL